MPHSVLLRVKQFYSDSRVDRQVATTSDSIRRTEAGQDQLSAARYRGRPGRPASRRVRRRSSPLKDLHNTDRRTTSAARGTDVNNESRRDHTHTDTHARLPD